MELGRVGGVRPLAGRPSGGPTHTLTDSVAEGDGGGETEALRVANEKPSKQYLLGI